jgi:hypothetical protein
MDELATCPKCGAITRTDPCTRCGADLSDVSEMLSVSVPGLALDGEPAVDTPPRAADPKPMQRSQAAAYLVLQPSETAVLHAASRVMAGLIANGEVSADNENDQADRAVRIATRMALVIEKYIQSDNEDW